MAEGVNHIQLVIQPELAAFQELYERSSRDFVHLEQKAHEVSEREYARLGSQPVGEDWGGDIADLAERAKQDRAGRDPVSR